jgi:hypothetical protein
VKFSPTEAKPLRKISMMKGSADATCPRSRPMPSSQPSAASSIAPSAYFRQHVAGIEAPEISARAFQPGWRRVSQLDKLLRAQAISVREWQAATWYRQVHERAFTGELTSSTGRLDAPGRTPYCRGRQDPNERRLEALAYLKHVRGVLGTAACAFLEAYLVEDLSWCALGQRFGLDRRKARRVTIKALRTLALI